MADESVQVRFGANTAPVEDGANTVKGAITSIGATVRGLVDLFLELGGAATGSFREIRTGAVEAGEAVKGTAEAVTAMGEAISGIGEALVAAFAVEQIGEFIRKMGEGAERIVHLGQAFGLTTNQVQQLQAEATLAGVPFETLSRNMSRLDVAATNARNGMKQQVEVFKELGINIKAPVDQATLLSEALAGLRNIADPITRAADANKLFGRSWVELAPLIQITKEKAAEYNAEIDSSGAINAEAVQHGEALADANNKLNVAFAGLGNALMDALAPALTQLVINLTNLVKAFTESYTSGGAMKQSMDVLAVTVKVVVGTFEVLGYTVKTVVDVMAAAGVSIVEFMKGAVDEAVGLFRQLWDLLEGLGRAAQARLAGDFNGAQQAMSDAFERMQIDADKTTQQLVADAAIAGKAWLQVGADIAGALKDVGSLIGGDETDKGVLAGSQMRQPGASPPAGGGGGHHGGHAEDPDKKQIEAWAKEQENADLKVMADTNNFNQSMLAADLAFWQKKLTAATEGSALWYDILAKFAPLAARQVDEEVREITKGVDEEIKERERLTRSTKEQSDAQVHDIIEGVEEELKMHKSAVDQMITAYRQFNTVIDPMVHSFTHGLLEMVEGTKSFAQVLRSIGQQILEDFISKVIDPMIEKWLWSEARQTLAHMVGLQLRTSADATAAATSGAINAAANREQVTQDAKVAAANVYKSLSAIPVIGPFIAPVGAAAAFAAVEAFSAAGGMDIGDFSPMIQAHPREMVLPARIAEPMRDMAENYGRGSGGGEAGHSISFGDTHFHGTPNMSRQQFDRLLTDHRDLVAAHVKEGVRAGRI